MDIKEICFDKAVEIEPWQLLLGSIAGIAAILSVLAFQGKIEGAYSGYVMSFVFGASSIFIAMSFLFKDEEKWTSPLYIASLMLITLFFASLGISLKARAFSGFDIVPLLLGILIILPIYSRFREFRYQDNYLIIIMSYLGFWLILNKFSDLGTVGLLLAANTALLIGFLSYTLIREEEPIRIPETEKKKIEKEKRRFIAIASGKGGVGKTTIAANLGVVLSKLGRKVAVADMDLAMPNLEILMGLKSPPVGLIDVLEGGLGIKKVIYEGPEGVRVIPSGIILDGFTDENVEKIRSALKEIPEEMEFVIIDMPPGREAVKVLEKGHEVLLVVNPEVTSVADALNMKVLAEGRGATIIGAVLNRVEGKKEELSIEEIEKAIDLQVISTIPEDRRVNEALSYEIPFVLKYPNSRACTGINNLAAWLVQGKEGEIKSR